MQTDCGIEQILARAILDLELKMKHEMRQNSALQLAKIEKHSQQMEKRLGIVEAKLEALLSRENNSSSGGMGGPNSHHLHYRGGNRQPQYSAGSINRQTSYYSRTANLAGGHHQSDKQQIPRTTTPVSRTHQHFGPMFGSQNNTPQHHRQHFASGGGGNERKQQRPKQMVGTGANKAQIVKQQEKPPLIAKNETWTTKLGGVYTSGEDSDEENGSTKTRSGSESCYSVAKPAPKCGEIVSADEEEKAPSNKEYSDEEEEEEIDEEKKGNNAKGLNEMMVLVEEETKTTKTAISNSNCTFKSSLEEEIVLDGNGKKKKVDDDEEDLNGSDDDADEDNNQLSFNTAKESDSFLHVKNAIALPFHDYEYPLLMASSSNDNAPKIVETKEAKKKGKMSIVSAQKTAQMPSAAPAQTIGGFGRGRRN